MHDSHKSGHTRQDGASDGSGDAAVGGGGSSAAAGNNKGPSPYELKRLACIARNEAILAALGLGSKRASNK